MIGAVLLATLLSGSGWEFSKDATNWTAVTVPHDWAIAGPFNPKERGWQGKLPWKGEGHYRRTFSLSPDEAKRLAAGGVAYLEFDGVMASPRVRLNGTDVGDWDYGYLGFTLDVTKSVRERDNRLDVDCSTKHLFSRWYPGAGLYRDVRLAVRPKDHVVPGSLRITTEVADDSATVTAAYVSSANGPEARTFAVKNPHLWSLDDPHLCTLELKGEKFRYGIRTFRFDAAKGFFLNGRRVQLKGVNLHSDLGPLGMAFDRDAFRRQLLLMKDMGFNALRTSHNPPAPQVLELCDEMGVFVWNECFDKWEGTSGRPKGENLEDYVEKNLRQFVRRDRNHPSVFVWSVGNEVWPYHEKDAGGKTGMTAERHARFVAAVKDEDATRPVGIGCSYEGSAASVPGLYDAFDITGWNYAGKYNVMRRKYPDKPVLYTESASAVSECGFYELPPASEKTGYSRDTLQIGSYDHCAAPWGDIPDCEFARMERDRHCGGEFVWTGIDYLGEPTPITNGREFGISTNNELLARSSYFGICDLCGIPKDRFYLYRSYWNDKSETVHLVPNHWNFSTSTLPVCVYTSGGSAELFLNGRSLGIRRKGEATDPVAGCTNGYYDVTAKYRLRWGKVPFEPGELKAVAYRDGKRLGETVVRTAERPVAVRLTDDPYNAPDAWTRFVQVDVVDIRGTRDPFANDRVTFKLDGPGRIVAVGNGNPKGYDSFADVASHPLHYGKCAAVVRRTGPGRLVLKASVKGLADAELEIRSRDSEFAVKSGEPFVLPLKTADDELIRLSVTEAGRGMTALPGWITFDAERGELKGRYGQPWTQVFRVTARNAAGRRTERLVSVRFSEDGKNVPPPAQREPVVGRFWTMSAAKTVGGTHRLDEFSRERVTVWSKRGRSDDKFAETEVMTAVERDLWTQIVMMFSCRSATGRLVRLTPLLEYLDRGKPALLRGEQMALRGAQWRNFQFPLNQLFPLGDGGIRVLRIGFAVDIENWNPGEAGLFELKNVRLCKAGEVSFSGNVTEERVTVVPGKRPLHAFSARPDALKIFFAFDNEDLIPSVNARNKMSDEQQDGGFRERLLEHLDGAATWTTNLNEAALIVYTRNRKDPQLAAAIATAVRGRGVPLLAASDVVDPEIHAILPVTLDARDPIGLASRAKLVSKEAPAALTKDLSETSFGIYRGCVAKEGVRRLIDFADGTPAVVEGTCGKGRVLYSMLGLGQTVVPGKRAYDAFFVRLASHLTGVKLPEAQYDGCPYALGNGWYRGIGTNDFGRFGWEIGSGLLVERLGNTFQFSRGDDEYSFHPHADRSATYRDVSYAPEDVSALSIGGRILANGKPFARFDASLAYPGTRWDIAVEAVDMDVTGPLVYLAVRTRDGVKVVKAGFEPLPDPKTWVSPWLCLFKVDAKAAPLLVTFARRPDAVRVLVEDACPAALLFERKGGVGVVVTAWPFGAASHDTSAWTAGGPDAEALARFDLWASRAFRYPYALDEKFRLSADGRRFEIVDTYRFREVKDEGDGWRVKSVPYAPVPPMARFMSDLFATTDAVEPRLVTRWGDFADLDGSDTVRWSLPVPEPDLSLLPHTHGFEKYSERVNDEFAHAVKYSCGGRTPLDGRTKEFPRGPHCPFNYNLDMHTMLLGMCRCLPNPFGYTPENRALMMRRARLREMEPLETAAYKLAVRYRREPFTDVPYTIYMHSWRTLLTKYAPARFGSKTMYGDSNETVRMIASALQMLADRHGQTDAVAANWETLRRFVASYVMTQDDWLLMASGCIEDCAVAGIDMLNTEYGTLCSLARLAEIAGDEDLRTVYRYRAARRAVPTIARLRLKHYHAAHGLFEDASKIAISTGFGEGGPSFRAKSAKRVTDVDLYDMSQGIPQDLISLYDRYAGTEIRDNYIPQVDAATMTDGLNYIMAAILAIGGDIPEARMIEKLDLVMASKGLHNFFCSDWPGMDSASYLEFVFAKYRRTPRLTDCRDVDLHEAVYDPRTKTLTLDVTPGAKASLAVDGKSLSLGQAGVRTKLEVRK